MLHLSKSFTGMEATPPISTLLRTATVTLVTADQACLDRILNVDKLLQVTATFPPTVQHTLQSARECIRNATSRGACLNVDKGDFLFVACEKFNVCDTLSLRWHSPHRIAKALSEHVYQVEVLRNGQMEDVNGSRLKFCYDASLDKKAVISHFVSSETGMPVQRFMRWKDSNEGLMVFIRR